MGEVEFIDNSGTPAVRVSASARADGDTTIFQIFVVEYDASINVQQIAISLFDGASINRTITDVTSQADAFMIYSYQYTNPVTSDDDWDDAGVQVRFNGASTTSVTLSRRASAGTCNGTLYVVDCDSSEWTVQHIEIDVTVFNTTSQNSAAFTAVVLADTFLVCSYETGEGADDIRDGAWAMDLNATTTVRARRAVSGSPSASATISVAVVECNNNEWDVQRNGALTLSATSVTDSITTIDEARSIIVTNNHSGQPFSVGRGDSTTGNAIDDVQCAGDFSDSSTVRYRKRVATTTNDVISYEVVQFADTGPKLKSIAGALAPAGALVKETARSVAGALAPAGALVKETLKNLAGALTPTGALARSVQFARTVAGSLTPAGGLVKQTQKNVAGVLTPIGALVKQTLKNLAGVLAPIGTLVKQTLKNLAGALTPIGDLVTSTVFLRALAGSLTPVGTLAKQTQKSFAGALTPVGTLVKRTLKNLAGSLTPVGGLTALKAFFKSIAGSLTPIGALAKQTQKSFAGALTPVGAIVKQTQKNLAGVLTPIGTLVKETLKNLAGALTPTGAFSTTSTFGRLLAGALTPSGSIVKQIRKSFAGALTPSGAIVKQTQKNVDGAVTPTGDIEKETSKNVAGSVTPTGALVTALRFAQTVLGALAPTGALGTLFIAGGGGPVGRVYRRALTVITTLRHRNKDQR